MSSQNHISNFSGISKPLKSRNKTKTMITVKIIFVWIGTVLISCPIAIAALLDSTNIFNRNTCVITNRYYMIYGSTFAFLIPFLIMAITFIRTTQLLKQQTVLVASNQQYHQTATATSSVASDNNPTRAFILRRTCTRRNYNSPR
ncbi:unnamed protein product [Gongylonema pulchrum]|uniref:G_PROTEIN_RECEP_F1_2 domain-containing protein n=1 Tax=Gongylonema pulchrum TaxID=637853 RepID=A0A183EXR4_9BILA|nr:unnamed protein product [Gongylonema pulchrum]